MKKYASAIRVDAVKLRRIGCVGLLLLVGCVFCLDVFHGIELGQDRTGFQPIYRLRQSLAIAISRMHDPSPGHYLAYKSVVNVFNENGFAVWDEEPGPHLDVARWEVLLTDGPLLNRIIEQAVDAPIDTGLPPEIIQANELGFADYIYFSFRLFGGKISSLYYFFYLIVAATCLVYILQFRNSPFLLFVLVIFLGELFFLENYARSYGMQMQTVFNSRLFSGLSLMPVLHVLFLHWQRQPPRAFSVAGVIVQSLIFGFLLSCRTEAIWQVAMAAAVVCGSGILLLLPSRSRKHSDLVTRLVPLWPALTFLIVVSGYSAIVSLNVDSRYALEPKAHIVWHEMLLGLLTTSPELRREYLDGKEPTHSDVDVYWAVDHDLKARDDVSSPVVRRLPNGDPVVDLAPPAHWNDYEKLVRSLVLRIVLEHPVAVIETVPIRIEKQILWFNHPAVHSMAWVNVRTLVIVVAAGALICAVAGGFTVNLATLGSVALFTAVLLLFASMTTLLVEPSPHAVGSLFAYLGVIAVAVPGAVLLLTRAAVGLKPKLDDGGYAGRLQSTVHFSRRWIDIGKAARKLR
jgi:hypothetical protein